MGDLTCIKHGYCKIIRDYFTNGICCGAKYCVQIIEKKWNRIGGLKVEQQIHPLLKRETFLKKNGSKHFIQLSMWNE